MSTTVRRRPLQRTVGAAVAVAEGLLERRGPGLARRLTLKERRTEAVAASLYVLVGIALPLALRHHFENVTTAVLLVLCYALVRRVRFPLGPGLLRPTQLVFVPMIFLTPAPMVPALVALGSLLGELPEIAARRAHRERLLVTISDCWYAVGPAIVIGIAAGSGNEAAWWVLLLALAAQFATDLAASSLREWFGADIAPAELLSVLALVYLIDALLAPVGYLAVLAGDAHEYAYLLAIAPGAVLGLLTRERSERIAHELALERAFRRSTRALDARAQDLRRLRLPRPGMGEAGAAPQDRKALERILLTTVVEALEADCGRLSALTADGLEPRLVLGTAEGIEALAPAEQSLGTVRGTALAVAVGGDHILSVSRARPFTAVERDLLDHLAAQAAVSLENLRLGELMRRTEAELRAILEGVAEAIAAEDPDGRLVYRNAAAAALLGDAPDLASRLGVSSEQLPGRRALRGAEPTPLVVHHEARWSRVKSSPVLENGRPRLAISVIEDITEIKQAEEAQRAIARTLQESLLPPELPEVPGFEAAALYRPAIEEIGVGGDFYDLFATADGEWFAVMGDVCGKGADAAAVTALARYTLRAAAMRSRSPAVVLRRLNASMRRQSGRRFVTIACAHLDLATTRVTLACAGHPPARILRADDRVESLGAFGTVLGVLPEVAVEDRDATLEPGDALILYTDGLTEATAPKVWTSEQLDHAVAAGAGRTAEGIVSELAAAVEGPLRDDLALLVLRRQPLL